VPELKIQHSGPSLGTCGKIYYTVDCDWPIEPDPPMKDRAMSPRVTVLMPVYNAAPHLLEAVNSILTGSFKDLELLAINDGSTDESEEILQRIADPRLRVTRNPANEGVIATLNRGLDLAEGDFIARMDADDVSMPDRLARQVAFMDENPEIGLSGTWARTFGARPERMIRVPLSPVEIHMQLFAFNAICHPTVILRRNLFARYNLRYSADARHGEDLDLWMRASNYFGLANLPIVGLRYRVHASQVTQRFEAEQQETLAKLRRRQLLPLVSDASEAAIKLHLKALDVRQSLTHDELVAIGEWLKRLEDSNSRVNRYDASAFHSFLVQRWLNAAHRCKPRNIEVWHIWRRSSFASVGMATGLWILGKMALHR
jgi:glycosyltransferase involved in cell wall biosynthesis